MKNNYTYPAKLIKDSGVLAVKFIDFDIYAEGDDMDSLIESAQTQLAMMLIDYDDRGEEPPKASSCEKDVIYIHVWLPYYKTQTKEIYVRKNVTIPQWLDLLAKEKGINYSAALVKGLKTELGME